MALLATIAAPFSVGAHALLGSGRGTRRIQTREGISIGTTRSNVLTSSGSWHLAWDIGCPAGTPIYAPHSGKIVKAGGYGTCGITVGIQHGNMRSDLCHLSQTNVFEGETVRQGDLVGLSGNTGNSYGAHLHWQMFRNGNQIVPMDALRASQLQAVMIGTIGVAGVATLLWWAVG